MTLSTRYIHLHEALGLGPMWLNASTRVLAPPENNTGTPPAARVPHQADTAASVSDSPNTALPAGQAVADNTAGQVSQTSATPVAKPAGMLPARFAALQKVGSKTLQHTDEIAPAPTAPPAAPTLEYWLAELSGSIAPVRVAAFSVCASPADITAGHLFSGEVGGLLQKMFAAIHLSESDVLLSAWLKGLPDFNPQPSAETVTAAAPRVAAEVRLSGARALLLMGAFFEREDVLAEVRALGLPYFMIPHPQRILGDAKLKRSAWNELQALAAQLEL